jgi:hypothetical protein
MFDLTQDFVSVIFFLFTEARRARSLIVEISPREQKKNLRERTNRAHTPLIGGRAKPRLRIGRCP